MSDHFGTLCIKGLISSLSVNSNSSMLLFLSGLAVTSAFKENVAAVPHSQPIIQTTPPKPSLPKQEAIALKPSTAPTTKTPISTQTS